MDVLGTLNVYAIIAAIIWVVIAFTGLVFFMNGLVRLFTSHAFGGLGRMLIGTLLGGFAALLAALVANLYTYDRLTAEQEVATVQFKQIAPQRFAATLTLPDGEFNAFELYGDEWQLDARVLKWKSYATILGLDANYRLERISGRYRISARELSGQERSVYDLSEEFGLEIWKVAMEYQDWFPWVDSIYGSATYLPMADGAEYSVSMSSTGLLARPANTAAKAAMLNW
ncbi:MAG: cation/multidrug efflux pump [Gammaproteobacteria bacterium]|nr:cation/multidrug efflux pump [Gammaproteobacteria bacterium]